MASGGDVDKALSNGGKMALTGAGTGVVFGTYAGIMESQAKNLNVITGKPNKPVTEENVILYRNFGWNEDNSLKENGGKFSIHPNNFQGKQFWLGEGGINMWEATKFAKPITVKLSIPKSFVTPGNPNYIFMEKNPIIDLYPGGTVLQNNLNKFNSNIRIIEFRY